MTASTHETYTAWMRHGLDVLAAVNAEPAGETAWPATASTLGRRSEPPTVTVTSPRALQQARDRGWLLTGPAPAATETTTGTTADGPLHGVDVAVKDIIDVAGLPTRNGTPGALWRDPGASSTAWQRLTLAGARCVGKAATHEMAWGVTTPQISHPLDSSRITGGSSGGSAACVATGTSHAAIGTDTGGSIRVPAALCGVVGFRPTTGTVDGTGITPLAPSQDVPGILAADVTTCIATLEVLLGSELGTDTTSSTSLRVGILARTGRLQPEVEEAYRHTLASLEESGIILVPCDTELPRQSGSISLLTMLLESAQQHAARVRADPDGFGPEARVLLTIGHALQDEQPSIAAARQALAARTSRLFEAEKIDAFLTPTTPCTAPARGAETVDVAGRYEHVDSALTRFTAWSPVVTMPAISVPITTNPMSNALPIGMQVMAPPHREDICARLALTIERLTRRNAA